VSTQIAMTPAEGPEPLTGLLRAWSAGDRAALDALLPLVYSELRAQARRHLVRERRNHTLQPTALVHETFLRLQGQQRAQWQNRQQFFAVAARTMRRVLVDHARARFAAKRGAGQTLLALDDVPEPAAQRGVDVLALDQALERLADLDPRQARVVELRYFGGLSAEETAATLEVSLATVNRDWALARAWLFRELGGGTTQGPQ
jgi:RNA polymerase sigma factor (TIGR02999 family)